MLHLSQETLINKYLGVHAVRDGYQPWQYLGGQHLQIVADYPGFL